MDARKRILFVDDEPHVLAGLKRMLFGMAHAWDMHFATGGEEALAILAVEPFDVLVTDMRMPGMDGSELLARVMERHPKVVRLILSGHADRDLVARSVGVAHQYLSKPCRPEELKARIQEACLLSQGLVSERAREMVGRIHVLPSVPRLFLEIEAALRDEQVGAHRIGDIVARDIAMTATLLKVVNSAFFGLRKVVASPQEAVTYLGVETVKALVLSHALFNEARPLGTRHFDLEDLRRHSLAVAQGAKALLASEGAPLALQEEAFVGGILHDLGVLVLALNFPGTYDAILARVQERGTPLAQAEAEVLGADHAEVGAFLLGLWGLPAGILRIVGHHMDMSTLSDPGATPTVAVHLANLLGDFPARHPLFGVGGADAGAGTRTFPAERLEAWRKVLAGLQEA